VKKQLGNLLYALDYFTSYMGWLEEYSTKYTVDIHVWVLMMNCVYLLCKLQKIWGGEHNDAIGWS